MRIRTVTIEGFGPFKEKQEIDFASFDADGLFLIGGETGAGKSTILDGIAYALYGKTPRWEDSTATGVGNRVRSDFCGQGDPTSVVLEFEINQVEYRVTRSPAFERPKGRGEGTTRQAAKVLVESLDADGWRGLATKEREAAELIERLVRLNGDEFLQVILLAQGRFQAFLLATSEERLELLSKLFGAKRFRDYQVRIAERRSALAKQVESSRTRQAALLTGVTAPAELGVAQPGHEIEWIAEVREHAELNLQHAEAAVEDAEKQEEKAGKQFELAQRQRRLADAQSRLALLEAQRPAIKEKQAVLDRGARAERVRPLIDAAGDASDQAKAAQQGIADARSQYRGDATDEAIAAEVRRLDGEIAKLVDALKDEQRAAALSRKHAAKVADVEALTERLSALESTIASLAAERIPLVPVAARAQSHRDEKARLGERLAAATAAEAAKARLAKAQEAQLAADRALSDARTDASGLLDRLLHGQAASLAATLVDGQPCAVCGSRSHPAPATSDEEPVSQESVDAAQAVADELEPAAATARQSVDAIREELARLSGVAGSDPTRAIAAELEASNAALQAATRAADRMAAIDAELDGDQGHKAIKTQVEDQLKDAGHEAATLKAEHEALRKNFERLRGDHPTIAARHGALTAERSAAQQLLDALAALAIATEQRSAAEARLTAKAHQEDFESVADATAALLDKSTVTELSTVVAAHQEAVNELGGILKQPELQGLPADVVDPAAAELARTSARAVTKDAVAARTTAKVSVETVRRQQKQLAELLASSAELNAEYETIHRLTETVHGRNPNTKSMSLESYFVAAELEDVLAAANMRLGAMSHGRYALQHTERGTRRAGAAAGLELEVMDEYTGKARDPHTLSGGEQFLTSLALALGLAEVVTSRTGAIELETLFVDEGFGSLSPEYLDIAMATLDSLKQGGRTVGVISHVESMKETIASQLHVSRSPGGPSVVEQRLLA